MLKPLLDAVMERRARDLMELVGTWLPHDGKVLDLGSGTGHLSARVERELGVEVVTADVSDIHVVGRPPVLIADGVLPFEEKAFSAVVLFFMLAYPHDPARVLAAGLLSIRPSEGSVARARESDFGRALAPEALLDVVDAGLKLRDALLQLGEVTLQNLATAGFVGKSRLDPP